jgi:uncharacterized membrane protein YgdD (TMEM256/DUF423 family)
MTNKKVANLIFGIITGLIAYAIIGKLGLYLLQVSWSDYAIRSIDKSYTLEMLLTRQFVGILASITAGITATKIANDNGKSAWFVGTIVFCGGFYIHFMTKTWTEYPVWYHFAYVTLIIPVIGLSRFFVTKKSLINECIFKTMNR